MVGGLPHDDRASGDEPHRQEDDERQGCQDRVPTEEPHLPRLATPPRWLSPSQTIVTSALNATFSPASTTRRSTSERESPTAPMRYPLRAASGKPSKQSVGATIRAIPRDPAAVGSGRRGRSGQAATSMTAIHLVLRACSERPTARRPTAWRSARGPPDPRRTRRASIKANTDARSASRASRTPSSRRHDPAIRSVGREDLARNSAIAALGSASRGRCSNAPKTPGRIASGASSLSTTSTRDPG